MNNRLSIVVFMAFLVALGIAAITGWLDRVLAGERHLVGWLAILYTAGVGAVIALLELGKGGRLLCTGAAVAALMGAGVLVIVQAPLGLDRSLSQLTYLSILTVVVFRSWKYAPEVLAKRALSAQSPLFVVIDVLVLIHLVASFTHIALATKAFLVFVALASGYVLANPGCREARRASKNV